MHLDLETTHRVAQDQVPVVQRQPQQNQEVAMLAAIDLDKEVAVIMLVLQLERLAMLELKTWVLLVKSAFSSPVQRLTI
jgi:hypothetical protein